jgi:HD-like signal output (HDOD) protein
LLTRDQVLERVAGCAQSKTLAGVVSQVVSIASSPRGTVADLVSMLKQDLVLATRVLQVANTVKYASNKPRIATVEEAVRNIGLSAVRNIALSAGVFEAFPSDARDGFSLIRCWQHSLAVSEVLDRLLAGAEGIEPGMAHLVGLCHDLGEVVLRQCLAEQYDVLAQVGDGSAVATHQVESAAFGIPYPELVERILVQLGLPAAIVAPVREHADRRARPTSRLATALSLADNYAHGLQLASSPRAAVGPIAVAEYKAVRAGGDVAPLAIDGETLRAGVLASTCLLARLSGPQEVELAKPLVPATRLRVWYARHSALSAFDPLEAALRSLAASVLAHDRLPQPAEDGAYDVLVVAAAKAGLAPLSVPDAERAAAAGGGKRLVYLSGTDAADVPVTSAVVRRYPVPLSALAELLTGPHA